MTFSPHSILVTGGAGFIGQNLVEYVLAQQADRKVVVLDALTYASNPTLLERHVASGRMELVRGDITDRALVKELFAEHKFDAVTHLAAESHVDRSIAEPDVFVRTNVLGTHVLLDAALADWRRRESLEHARFLHISTDEVFGDLDFDEPAFTENSPYRPSSPYSATKAASDHLARAYHRTYKLPVIVTNCSNNYGPRQHPEKLIPLSIIRALRGESLPIYGDGMNIRDWLFVEDHCHALWLALTQGLVGLTYNIGGGTEQANKTVAAAICAAIDEKFSAMPSLRERFPNCPAARGKPCGDLITFVKDRAGHDRRYAIDPAFAEQALGYRPAETFKTGLNRTIDWYLEHNAWWERALSPGFHTWIEDNYAPKSRSADAGVADGVL